MIYNESISKSIANDLIRIEAVKISVGSPFTWTSGIKSPVYCDNRITLSDVDVRNNIKNSLVNCITEKFPEVNCIAGVATAGIPQGAIISDSMNLPFVYVRNKPKGHGLGNQIEGRIKPGQKVVVVEDLVSIVNQEYNRASREWNRRLDLKANFENGKSNELINI